MRGGRTAARVRTKAALLEHSAMSGSVPMILLTLDTRRRGVSTCATGGILQDTTGFVWLTGELGLAGRLLARRQGCCVLGHIDVCL